MTNYFGSLHKKHVTLIIICSVVAAIWPLYYINLFPLSEARDWLGWWASDDIVHQVISNLVARNTRFSRDFSMLLTFGIGRLCASSVLCVNFALSVPLVASVVALFALLNALTGRKGLAALFACMWAVSVPFLATAAWQATIHDRIGALCALSAMALSWSLRSNASAPTLLFYSLIMAVLAFASLNSKEAYWFVPPAIVFCHWMRAIEEPTTVLKARDVITTLPLLTYSSWYFYRYWTAGELSVDWTRHVGSGDIVKNIFSYARASFGGLTILMLLTSLLTVQLLQTWPKIKPIDRRKIIWCLVVCALSYIPIARTRFTTEYYLLAPLAMYLTLAAVVLANRPAGARYCNGIMALFVFLGTVGIAKALNSDVASFYRERSALSENFLDSIASKSELPQSIINSGALCVASDPRQRQAYLFTDSPFAWNILRWGSKNELLRELQSIPAYQSARTDCTLIQLDKNLRLKASAE